MRLMATFCIVNQRYDNKKEPTFHASALPSGPWPDRTAGKRKGRLSTAKWWNSIGSFEYTEVGFRAASRGSSEQH